MGFWGIAAGLAFKALSGSGSGHERNLQSHSEDIRKFSLSCRRCGEHAKPIEGTGNRYECICGNKFAGARHTL